MPDSIAPSLQPWPRRPARLATAVTDALVEQVVGGAVETGGTLPTEPALCDTFGVSRTVVREAVKALETMRLVTVQQGHGTTVRPIGEWDLLNPAVLAAVVRHDAELAILDDLVDVRRALEAQMAGQAASRVTPAEHARLTQRYAELDASVEDSLRYRAADIAFHDEIHALSGNRLGRAIIHTLTEEAYRSLRYVGDPTPDECRLSNVAHRKICDLVLAGDVEGSTREMNDHILEAWHRRRPTRADVARGR